MWSNDDLLVISSGQNGGNTIGKCLTALLDSETLIDCVFYVGPEKHRFPTHKVVLASRSDYFCNIFNDELKESRLIPTEVNFCPKNIQNYEKSFNTMLRYLYTDIAVLETFENSLDVYVIAKVCLLNDLKDACCKFIRPHIAANNISKILDFGLLHEAEEIVFECSCYISNNTFEILTKEILLDISVRTMERLVKSRYLCIDTEAELIKAVERWAVHISEKEGIALDKFIQSNKNIFSELRYLSLAPGEFSVIAHKTLLLTIAQQREIFLRIAMKTKQQNSLPKLEWLSNDTHYRGTNPRYLQTRNYGYVYSDVREVYYEDSSDSD